MKTTTTILLFLWTACCSAADIPVDQRVPNDPKHGVCWFACAETLANAQGLPTLQGLRARVVTASEPTTAKTFKGWGLGGAYDSNIGYWLDLAKVKRRYSTRADVNWLRSALARSPGVIVTVKSWHSQAPTNMTHAVIVTEVTWTGREWKFRFIDPNDIKQDFVVGQQWFLSRWHRYASYFDAADQANWAEQMKPVQFARSGFSVPPEPPTDPAQ